MNLSMKNAIEKTLAEKASGPLLSHFTPSLMAPATLEAILVEREELAAELVGEVLESATNPTKAQTLLVGPRGIGKTHLVALVYHRVRAAKPENLCIAWLREDEYGVVSWLDWLLRIFRALEEAHPGTTPRAELQPLFDLPNSLAEGRAQTLLENYLAGRTLWLLVENLDAIFSDIKEMGQRKWRAWMQEHPLVTTLATTPGLFGGVSGRAAPFYGFFRIEHLQPLDVEGAALLLRKIARLRGDEELAEFIDTPAGHARVRAVHHLAGGNFRIYVVFGSLLKRDSLDELVAPFLQLLDELTPYYQSHLAALSSQQRKIIEVLCDYGGAMPVKLLASRGFMSQQTASSHLGDLRARGYVVVARTFGRESLYELREPLLRLCLQVKKQRGEPIAILVDFLRVWYRREELTHHLDLCAPGAHWERQYLTRALAEKEKETEDPVAAACERDLNEAMDNEQWDKALRICDELEAIRIDIRDMIKRTVCLWLSERGEEALSILQQALRRNTKDARIWYGLSIILDSLNRQYEAYSSIEKAIHLAQEQEDKEVLGLSLLHKGQLLGSRGNHYEALKAFNRSLKNMPGDQETLFQKASSQSDMWRFNAALKTFRRLEKSGYRLEEVQFHIADALLRCGQSSEAFDRFKRLSQQKPDVLSLQVGLAVSALEINDFPTALNAADRALELGDISPCARFHRAQALLGLRRDEEGVEVLRVAVSAFGDKFGHLVNHLFSLMETLYMVFEEKPDLSAWGKIVRVFDDQNASLILSSALTGFATDLAGIVRMEREIDVTVRAKGEVRPAARKALAWSASWLDFLGSTEAGQYPMLQFAARLSDTAIRVAASGDDRPLFDLPSEERAVVRGILEGNLKPENADTDDDE